MSIAEINNCPQNMVSVYSNRGYPSYANQELRSLGANDTTLFAHNINSTSFVDVETNTIYSRDPIVFNLLGGENKFRYSFLMNVCDEATGIPTTTPLNVKIDLYVQDFNTMDILAWSNVVDEKLLVLNLTGEFDLGVLTTSKVVVYYTIIIFNGVLNPSFGSVSFPTLDNTNFGSCFSFFKSPRITS